MVPNKEEPESDSELTEEDATQPEQPEEPAEPAVENAVAEEPAGDHPQPPAAAFSQALV